ncbi:MAG: hypothetical protein JOZ58_12085 [Acetobacteraceae bacterium]|jgi:hypothetical protein|nr:hypothetical protein [Acetobacteraceae bacterium]MBV8575758.1 hypothetical protein [Acetobacteraceae bacterium]
MNGEASARISNPVQDSKWLAGAWIGLTLSTLATTAAMLGVGAALSTAALPCDTAKNSGS